MSCVYFINPCKLFKSVRLMFSYYTNVLTRTRLETEDDVESNATVKQS